MTTEQDNTAALTDEQLEGVAGGGGGCVCEVCSDRLTQNTLMAPRRSTEFSQALLSRTYLNYVLGSVT